MTNQAPATSSSTLRSYVEMTKPRIIELLLITTIPAMVVAADGWPGFGLMVITLAGGALSAGGANVINQVYDEDIDRLMARTRSRPLPTERVSRRAATIFGIAMGVAGFLVLAVGATLLAGVLSVVAYTFYIFVYTMMLKRSSTQNIVIGGAAGAVPALIGWAAYAGELSVAAWVMFGVILYWTPPHFWALSLKYREDYRAAGIPMLSVVAGERATLEQIQWYSVVAAGVTLLLVPVAGLGWIYAATVCVLGCGFVFYAVKLRSNRSLAMRFFGFSNLYLAGVFLAMMVDRLVLEGSVAGRVVWLTVGTLAIAAGLMMVVSVERRPDVRSPKVSARRHAVEVGITVVFAAILVIAAWQSGS